MIDDTVLVYQMGRVGSVAMRNALNQRGVRVQHLHYANDEGEFGQRSLAIINKIYERDQQWKVITMVREPVIRNISGFFRDLPYQKYPEYDKKLYNRFMREYNHVWPLIWYDLELRPLFDFNIYSWYFDFKKKYQIIETENLHLLILRNENLNKAPEAIKEFLGLDDFELPVKNATKDRPGPDRLYRQFRKQAVFPVAYLEFIYDTKYAKHFYTMAERARFYAYWLHPEIRKVP
jgi:hypothetical protein